jgi:hypothetical protein
MKFSEKYDKVAVGIISGFLLPDIILLLVFLFAKGNPSFHSWLIRITQADVITHIISFCVFPNLLIFFLFNYFDMLRSSRGVLIITIVWALLVFLVKVLT